MSCNLFGLESEVIMATKADRRFGLEFVTFFFNEYYLVNQILDFFILFLHRFSILDFEKTEVDISVFIFVF